MEPTEYFESRAISSWINYYRSSNHDSWWSWNVSSHHFCYTKFATIFLGFQPKSGNWKTVIKRSLLRPWKSTTMGLDFTLSISIFAANEFFFGINNNNLLVIALCNQVFLFSYSKSIYSNLDGI